MFKKFLIKNFSNLTIKNVIGADGNIHTLTRPYHKNLTIDGDGLLSLPNCIDPHVHFRTPGLEHKEDWITGSKAAFRGGITTVFDMPNVVPPTTTLQRYEDKVSIIKKQISESNLPLNFKLFFGVDLDKLEEIEKVKDKVVGLKIFMTASSSDGYINNEELLDKVYLTAKKNNLIIATHAEDHDVIDKNNKIYENNEEIKVHSCVHSKEAALVAIDKIIRLTRKYNVMTYILHISTKDEIDLIMKAKVEGLPIYAETCPHYLFLDENYYPRLQGKCKMNPPLRETFEMKHLWEALNSGKIDTIGSDHAPHTLKEKSVNKRSKCPSGVPGIETTLPLLLTAWIEKKIDLGTIINTMHYNPKKMFKLGERMKDDFLLVNISDYRIVQDDSLATKVKWSPYSGMKLTGFPKYIFTNDMLYDVDSI